MHIKFHIKFTYKIKYKITYNLFIQWDTAGQERFKTITSAYYRGADGIIFVYDVSDRNSFIHIDDWNEDLDKLTTDNPFKIVI